MMTPPFCMREGMAACDIKKMPLTFTAKTAVPIGLGKVCYWSCLNNACIVHDDIYFAKGLNRFLNKILTRSAL